jgi:hypothetical protein
VSNVTCGVAYFGERTLRHVRADLEDIANSGFDYVVHCFTESDLLDNMENMRQIFHMTHELGMGVQVDPWGVAGVFGGEAFSKFVAMEMDTCQVLADGSQIGIACLWHPKLRAWLHRWIDAAIDLGTDVLFWDEPHWFPGDLWYYGAERGPGALRWSCRCGTCLERFRDQFGHDMPTELTDEVMVFRVSAIFDIMTDITTYAAGKDVTQTVCLLPKGQFHKLVHLPDWEPFASLENIDRFGTDAYWAVNPPVPVDPFLPMNAAEVSRIAMAAGKKSQWWVQGYAFAAGLEWEAAKSIDIALEHGITDLPVWAYRGCEAMSRLWPVDIEKTWTTIVEALHQAKAGEPIAAARGPK